MKTNHIYIAKTNSSIKESNIAHLAAMKIIEVLETFGNILVGISICYTFKICLRTEVKYFF